MIFQHEFDKFDKNDLKFCLIVIILSIMSEDEIKKLIICNISLLYMLIYGKDEFKKIIFLSILISFLYYLMKMLGYML